KESGASDQSGSGSPSSAKSSVAAIEESPRTKQKTSVRIGADATRSGARRKWSAPAKLTAERKSAPQSRAERGGEDALGSAGVLAGSKQEEDRTAEDAEDAEKNEGETSRDDLRDGGRAWERRRPCRH